MQMSSVPKITNSDPGCSGRRVDPASAGYNLARSQIGLSFEPLAMSDVTRILSQIESGDPSAAEQLLPLVYEELRKLAAAKLAQEKPGQTLQATALVHEAYMRLVDVEKASLEQPRPFLRSCRRSHAADSRRTGTSQEASQARAARCSVSTCQIWLITSRHVR